MHISKKFYFDKWNIFFYIFHCQVFIFHCQGIELRVKQYTTKCKICFSSSVNCVYNKKKIRILEWIWLIFHEWLWWTFVLSNEVKNVYFMSYFDGVNMTLFHRMKWKKCIWLRRHSWNTHFFTSLDEIKVIVTPKTEYPLYLSRISIHYKITSWRSKRVLRWMQHLFYAWGEIGNFIR